MAYPHGPIVLAHRCPDPLKERPTRTRPCPNVFIGTFRKGRICSPCLDCHARTQAAGQSRCPVMWICRSYLIMSPQVLWAQGLQHSADTAPCQRTLRSECQGESVPAHMRFSKMADTTCVYLQLRAGGVIFKRIRAQTLS